jgi:hypothetical protein
MLDDFYSGASYEDAEGTLRGRLEIKLAEVEVDIEKEGCIIA